MHIINAKVFASRKAGGQPSKTLMILFILLHITTIFLPLKFDSILFYIGLVFYLVGIFIGFLAIYSFATTPIDKPVTNGIFQYSRNPMYLGGLIFFIGIGLVSASPIYLFITLIWIILLHINDISIEELECIKKYGKKYEEYLKKTPRWIGVPKYKKK